MIKFKVIFLDNAKEFLDSLDKKPREKVLFNIWKSREVNDPELFKKLINETPMPTNDFPTHNRMTKVGMKFHVTLN
jgi:hypothetical protein